MIPKDHPIYEFPYNLEDRIKDRIKVINFIIEKNVDILVKKSSDKLVKYTLTFKNDNFQQDVIKNLKNINCVLDKNQWSLVLE